MKAIRVNKLKQELETMNLTKKVWFSEEEPKGFNSLEEFVSQLNADDTIKLIHLLEVHKHKVARSIITEEQHLQLSKLGFSVKQDWD